MSAPEEDPWVCGVCGSPHVEQLMWVNPNTREIVDDEVVGELTQWCCTCETYTERIVRRSEFLGTKPAT